MMAADDKDKHCELFVEITQLVVMPVMTIWVLTLQQISAKSVT
jgi:hypothetical protein